MLDMDEMFGVVGKENAVEMVYFVLKYLREEAARAACEARAVGVARANRDALVPLGRAVDAAHREASFVCPRPPARGLRYLRIDIHLYLRRQDLTLRILG